MNVLFATIASANHDCADKEEVDLSAERSEDGASGRYTAPRGAREVSELLLEPLRAPDLRRHLGEGHSAGYGTGRSCVIRAPFFWLLFFGKTKKSNRRPAQGRR